MVRSFEVYERRPMEFNGRHRSLQEPNRRLHEFVRRHALG